MSDSTLAARFHAKFDTGILASSNQYTPTPESIKFIENQLGIVLPETFVAVAYRCLAYTEWFAGIGQDYEWYSHILMMNKTFHNGEDALFPSNLILFTRCYDSICACFDLSNCDRNGDTSIVYCYLSDSDSLIEIEEIRYIAPSFDIYLEQLLEFWEKSA
jgi:hypothetical protein